MVAVRTLILAVPGTQDTRELDLDAVREGVAKGEIALDNWAWSPTQSAWLPLSQLPEYAPAVPAPTPAPPKVLPVTKATIASPTPVKVAATAPVARAVVPTARQATAPASRQNAATYYSKPIQDHNEFPVFKILFVVLGVIIAALVTVNYFLVDQPFRASLARSSFSTVQAHAHLGAFIQPNALLIHIVPSAQINNDNFADVLTALAQSAPRSAVAGESFSTLGLTSTWLSQYMITAEDWGGFADMSGYTPEEKKQFVLLHLEKSDGQPVFIPAKNDTDEARHAREDKAWTELVNHFRTP